MRVHARAASIAMAGAALLAASAVTATPAFAAPTVLTQATCEGGGGTFTVNKSLKTCVTLTEVSYNEDTGPWGDGSGDFSSTYLVHREGAYTTQTVQTQKGKGPIKTAESYVEGSGSDTTYVVADSRTCTQYVAGTGYVSVDVSFCEDLNLYRLPF